MPHSPSRLAHEPPSLREHGPVATPVPLSPRDVSHDAARGWVFPTVLALSLGGHGLVLALVAILPPPTYAIAPTPTELDFQVLTPAPEEAPPVVEEPEPEPEPVVERVRPAAMRPRPAEPPPEVAPPPPAPVLTAGTEGAGEWAHPEGEADGQLGGVPGGTGTAVGAAPPAPAPVEPAPRGMSRAELRRRLIGYIRNTLHGYVNERIEMPLVARRERLEGVVIVRVRLARDGSLLGARLSRSSGHDVLDQAAVASVTGLRNVPAPPADLPWDPDEELPLPVRYQIR